MTSPAGPAARSVRAVPRRRPPASDHGSAGRRRPRSARAAWSRHRANRSRRAADAPSWSHRSPARSERSIPPTNATSSSTTTTFSWWQCSVRSRASSTHSTRPPSGELVTYRFHRRCGWAGTAGSGGPAQSSTRTSTRPASSASSSASVGVPLSRRNRNSGVEVPTGDVDVRFRRHHRVVHSPQRIIAVDEHVDGIARPGCRGPGTQSGSAGGFSAPPWPSLVSRLRWCRCTMRSSRSPARSSRLSITGLPLSVRTSSSAKTSRTFRRVGSSTVTGSHSSWVTTVKGRKHSLT